MFAPSNVIGAHDIAPVDDLRFRIQLDTWIALRSARRTLSAQQAARVVQGRIRGGTERMFCDIFPPVDGLEFSSLFPFPNRGKVSAAGIKPHLPNVSLFARGFQGLPLTSRPAGRRRAQGVKISLLPRSRAMKVGLGRAP